MLSVQHTRNLSGSVSPDGSFFSEIRYLGNTTTVKDFYGRERVLTEALSNSGLQVIVRVEADGSVPEQSLKLNGLSKQQLDLLRDPLTATLKQTAQMAPLKLAFGSNAEQRLLLQIPIPGLTQLKVKATVSSQLVGLDRGVAEIQRLFSLDFETPAGVLKFTADGAGSGKSVYDTTSKLMLREETGILMRATFEFPEGTIEAEVTSKSLQTTRPTFSKTNDLRAHRWVQYYLISGNEPNDWDAHEIDIESLKITGELLQYSTRIKYADGSVGPPLEMQVNCAKGTRGQLPNPSMSATFQGTIGGQELRIACLAGVREFQ